MPWGEPETQPLNIEIVDNHSDSYAFGIDPITPPVAPFGKITAIRVQDLETFEFFNWDDGVWDRAPEVTVGDGMLYIAAWAENIGGDGLLQITIKDDTGAFLEAKSEIVPAGEGLGCETGTIDMPNRRYGILIMVEP